MTGKKIFGVRLIILAFLPLSTATTEVPNVSYSHIISNVQSREWQLFNEVISAMFRSHFVYVGAAQTCGTAIQSLCHDMTSACTLSDANICSSFSDHKADKEAANAGLRLDQVLYTDVIYDRKVVCNLEYTLIQACARNPTLCRNKSSRTFGHCIEGGKGIVYLRIYVRKDNTTRTPRRTESVAKRQTKATIIINSTDTIEVPHVHYSHIGLVGHVHRQESHLIVVMTSAMSRRYYIYVGAAQACGTAIQSLCHDMTSACTQTDANACGSFSDHKADKDAAKDGLRLYEVSYSNVIYDRWDVCEIEMRLIAACKRNPKFCRNKNAGTFGYCIEGRKGIVYLRIYEGKETIKRQLKQMHLP